MRIGYGVSRILWARGPFGPYYFQVVSKTQSGRPRVRELRTFQFADERPPLAHPVPNAFVSERVITTSVDRRKRVRIAGLGLLYNYQPLSPFAAALMLPFATL